MSAIVIILLGFAGLIGLILIIGLFMKKRHFVKREIIINAPRQKVYDFLRFLENQEKFNKWAKTDKDRIKEYKGTDGTVGYIYSWRGNKSAGQGEKEIMSLAEAEKIETEIRFLKPMKVAASVIMDMESTPDGNTRLYMTNTGILNYPLNLMIPMAEKNFGRDMSESLATLKSILENN